MYAQTLNTYVEPKLKSVPNVEIHLNHELSSLVYILF